MGWATDHRVQTAVGAAGVALGTVGVVLIAVWIARGTRGLVLVGPVMGVLGCLLSGAGVLLHGAGRRRASSPSGRA